MQRAAVEALIRRAVRAPWDPATVVAVGMTLLVLAMWMLKADEPRAHASAERIDTRAVDAPLAAVRERWEAETARLRDQVRALAVHDATYEFARRPNFPYVDDHFGPGKLAALAVDTVLIVDGKGRPIFWRRPNDPDNRGFPDAELFLAQLPKLPVPATREERGRPVFEGIVQFRGVPALVSAIAIEPATGDGAPRGYLVYGRAIDGAVSKRVLDGAPAGLDVMPATDALLPAEVRIRLDRSLTPLVVTDEQRIRGYLPLVDVQGRLVRVYAASAAKPAPAAAPAATQEERSSWPVVIGATLLLLLIGGGGLWWTFVPARAARPAPRSEVERLARALAAETHRGTKPLDDRVVPGMPQVAVAEALVGLGATADEPPAPEWLQARRDQAPPPKSARSPDDDAASRIREASDDAAADVQTPRPDPLEDGDDHEWLIGTPDEVLLGEHESVVADALDRPQARDTDAVGSADATPARGLPGDTVVARTSVVDAVEPQPVPASPVAETVDTGELMEIGGTAVTVQFVRSDEAAEAADATSAIVAADAVEAVEAVDATSAADTVDATDSAGAAQPVTHPGPAPFADTRALVAEPPVEVAPVEPAHAEASSTDAHGDDSADLQARDAATPPIDDPETTGEYELLDATRAPGDVDRTSDTATFEVHFEVDAAATIEPEAHVMPAPSASAPIAAATASSLASAEPSVPLASRSDAQAATVRRLLEDGRLRVHYQPQVSTANGTIVGVEALVRWEDDEAALRAAGELFGEGTSADSFSGATEFVLRRACADRRDWMRQIGRTLPVSVNVGLAELREPGFVERVLRILEDADLPAAYLEFEVPERALAVPGSPEAEALEQAYRSGIGIAIGGFVAADAPLRALTQIPVAKLKLHRTLIADLPDDTHARMVVDAVLAIGRTLNVAVCAEGVERPAQAAYLERRQCPLVQGWHYARPMEADQFFALMKGSGVDTVRLPLMDVEELEAHARAAGVV